ncbi:MAG: hypothetical protein PVJ86_13440 [Phycisphaerales bacterium]
MAKDRTTAAKASEHASFRRWQAEGGGSQKPWDVHQSAPSFQSGAWHLRLRRRYFSSGAGGLDER